LSEVHAAREVGDHVKALIRAHPLTSYYALTFAISWGGVLAVIGGPTHIPGTPEETARLLPAGVVALVLGPSIAGIVMTAIVYGRRGLRDLSTRLRQWRVGVRWYAIALVTTPLLAGGILLVLHSVSPVFLPGIAASHNKLALLLSAIGAGLFAGVFEETGWTGFAIPLLRARHGMLTTGLIAGVLWGVWHYIAALWGSGTPSRAWVPSLLVAQMTFYVLVLPAYRILMVWVNDRTGSLFVAMLMHASLTGNVLFMLMPLAIPAPQLISWYLGFAAVLWLGVAMVGQKVRHKTRRAQSTSVPPTGRSSRQTAGA
jgi:membrane protease YdiL (CAAX protease family)